MVAIETCPRLAVNAAIFLACFALPVASRLWRSLKWGEKAAVTIDPDNPHPDFLRDCFALVARSLDERPRRLRLEIDVRNKDGLGVKFDLERDGRYAFSVDGRRTCHADFRRRWIADHPVPLTMCGGRFRSGRVRLFVEPVDGNRLG